MSFHSEEIEKSTKITTNCSEICLKAKVFEFSNFTNKLKEEIIKFYKL